MRVLITAVSAALLLWTASATNASHNQPKNVILFVPDGLRALSVTRDIAPAMAAIRDQGVNFANSHSLFPTLTMTNASGLATGHYPGDTGVFSNVIYTGAPAGGARSVTPFLENDPVLGDIDEHFGGNFINEETLLKRARDAGYSTAAVGKLGPTLVFDHTERSGAKTIIIDDQTGTPAGIPLSDEIKSALASAGLPTTTPSRGENGKAGDARTAGTTTVNLTQQTFFTDAVTKIILPMFKARGKPFVLVVWSRDPDGSQHNQGDSLNSVRPGINGPTSFAAIKNADDNLAQVRQTLRELDLEGSTNIVVSADHGFSTISKESSTSNAAKGNYSDVQPGFLPPGFLALDVARALDLPLSDPDNKNAPVLANTYPRLGNGLIGKDPDHPDIVVAANGGSDLIYLGKKDRKLARRVVETLLTQDYVSGIFVDDDLVPIAGTLRLSSINLQGAAKTPRPAMVVNFRSYSTECDRPALCAVEIADTRLQQGQGMHGNFARSDTQNFIAAIGPDFKTGYVDPLPVSNADIGMTIARLLDLPTSTHGKLVGRVLTEAMPNGAIPQGFTGTLSAQPASNGLRTMLRFQRVQQQHYFDVAGFPGRTVGLDAGNSAGR
jgi:hypothetical protein